MALSHRPVEDGRTLDQGDDPEQGTEPEQREGDGHSKPETSEFKIIILNYQNNRIRHRGRMDVKPLGRESALPVEALYAKTKRK